MNPPRILIIEDGAEINQLVTRYLNKEGFETDSVIDGQGAVSRVADRENQLIILGLMLPKVDGQEVLRRIRERNTTPVIILSARDREMDKRQELGMDDYMAKPFTIGELVARVKDHLRRYMGFNPDAAGAGPTMLKRGGPEPDTGTCQATTDGQKKALTAKKFAIRKLLPSNPARVFTKSQIFHPSTP